MNKHQKITSLQISFNYFTSFFGESDGKKKKKELTEMGKSPTVVWRLDQLEHVAGASISRMHEHCLRLWWGCMQHRQSKADVIALDVPLVFAMVFRDVFLFGSRKDRRFP